MSRDTNFYYSFLVLPPEKRKAIIAVWDFCRAVDDAVDVPGVSNGLIGRTGNNMTREQALDWWKNELTVCFSGGKPESPQGCRLQPFISRFTLPRYAFERLIEGVEMDLRNQRYATFDELHQYCLRVASAVGLICVEIFGYQDQRACEYATELGIALQLTNIVRDVPADLARGRLYLPTEDLDRFGCTEKDLYDGILTESVIALLAYQCNRARAYYESARTVLPYEDKRRLVAAQIMGEVYFEILKRIEGSNYDVFSRVVRVPRSRRAVITVETWFRVMFDVRSPRAP